MSAMLPLFFPDPTTDSDRRPEEQTTYEKSRKESRASSTWPESGVNEKARKKRVVTEARKEQNKLAQRAFRQRRKEERGHEHCQTSFPSRRRVLRPRRREEEQVDGVCGAKGSLGEGTSDPAAELDAMAKDSAQDIATMPSVSDAVVHENMLAPSAADADLTALSLGGSSASLPSSSLSSPPASGWTCQQETSRRTTTYSSANALSLFPDPYANALRFLPTTIFGAILHNALALNFDLASLATCSSQNTSPLYHPSAAYLPPSTDPSALLTSTLARLGGGGNPSPPLPPDLRPTLAQMTIPHHASLDLIPVPALRDGAIMLSAAMPCSFNLWELKTDIYVRGGLVVWAGGGHQPWERRGWEAAPWFLRKWSMAVGGEEGELGRQSRWWRLCRDRMALPWVARDVQV